MIITSVLLYKWLSASSWRVFVSAPANCVLGHAYYVWVLSSKKTVSVVLNYLWAGAHSYNCAVIVLRQLSLWDGDETMFSACLFKGCKSHSADWKSFCFTPWSHSAPLRFNDYAPSCHSRSHPSSWVHLWNQVSESLFARGRSMQTTVCVCTSHQLFSHVIIRERARERGCGISLLPFI